MTNIRKMDSIEDHKNKFNEKVLEGQAKKGKNSRMLTKEHYLTTVERLKQLENLSEQRNLTDYNLMRRFALLRVESGGNIVEKLVKPGTNSRFVPFEDLFDVIHEVHIEKGHSGRDTEAHGHQVRQCHHRAHQHLQIIL